MTTPRDSAITAHLTRDTVLLACAPRAVPAGARRIGAGAGGTTLALLSSNRPAEQGSLPLKTFVRRAVAPLPARERNEVVDAAARAGDGRALSRPLRDLREALRERLPLYERGDDQARGVAAVVVLALDDHAFYIEGWAIDREAEIVRLEAVSPEGERFDLLPRAFRFPLPHVSATFGNPEPAPEEEPGFLCFLELEGPSRLDEGWVIEMENAAGASMEARAPAVLRDPSAARERVLADPVRRRLPDEELMEKHVRPAIERLQGRVEASHGIRSVSQFGDPPASPDVSIVIPLYKRIDLVEDQLAQFVLDPYLARQDIIYVLDSPEDQDLLLDRAAALHPLYRVPFRVVVLKGNVGFAQANNVGAGVAQAKLLLLLNSDVLPDRPGWLERMIDFYEAEDGIGALAPKLLYEDDSIQHAGIHFHRPEGQPVWQDAHYFKGMHRDFPDANVPRVVPVVSGACMMIARDLYESVGGLHGGYVQGDYEDADICLRLMEAGLRNWYLPTAELYHLEALSYSPSLRMPANRYNAWLHTRTWGDRIEQLEAGTRA
jgi:GT2 family glycosyltransferase